MYPVGPFEKPLLSIAMYQVHYILASILGQIVSCNLQLKVDINISLNTHSPGTHFLQLHSTPSEAPQPYQTAPSPGDHRFRCISLDVRMVWLARKTLLSLYAHRRGRPQSSVKGEQPPYWNLHHAHSGMHELVGGHGVSTFL